MDTPTDIAKTNDTYRQSIGFVKMRKFEIVATLGVVATFNSFDAVLNAIREFDENMHKLLNYIVTYIGRSKIYQRGLEHEVSNGDYLIDFTAFRGKDGKDKSTRNYQTRFLGIIPASAYDDGVTSLHFPGYVWKMWASLHKKDERRNFHKKSIAKHWFQNSKAA